MINRTTTICRILSITLGLGAAATAFAADPPKAAPAGQQPQVTQQPQPGKTPQPADKGKPPAAGAGSPYSGHGAESVSPELLAAYRPLPLPSEVSRRIQSMLDVRGPSPGTLSPDGKSLYFNWAVTGISQIWKIDGPRRFPVQLTGGEDPTILRGVTPDGKWLIVSRDRKGEENPGIYLQSPDGGPLIEVQHKKGVQSFVQFISDDSRYLYFAANDVKPNAYTIYRYDLQKREREAIVTDDGLWQVADVRQNGRVLLSKATGALSAEIFEFDPEKKAMTPLIGQGEKEEYEVEYGAADGEVLLQTNKMGEFRRVYSLRGGKLTPITPEMKYDVDGFGLDRKKTRVFYNINRDGFTRVAALDAKTYKPIPLPKRFDEVDHAYLGGTTPDSRYTTVGIDDGTRPLQSFVYDWKAKQLVQWHVSSAPEIDTTKFARAQLEFYPAKDGTKVPVLVRRPEQCKTATAPCPVVIHFHGGPEGQTKPGFSVFGQVFVDAGFIFAEPNVRGSDGYGKAWLHADDGPKRLDVITDIEDAAKWARQQFAVAGKAPKVGIYGGSYGGYSVLMGMTMFGGTYDAGVDVVGISDLRTFLKNTAPYRRILRVSEYGDPDKDADALRKLSPMTYLDKIQAPLLIFQGATDPRVPVGEAVQVQESAKKKGIASQLMIFPDEGHGAQKRENRVLMLGHTIAFFQKHLMGK